MGFHILRLTLRLSHNSRIITDDRDWRSAPSEVKKPLKL